MPELPGYAHPVYALSLREFGEPRELPRCGGWVLVRPIPNTPYKDAMGCYPLFACRDWSKLHEDLQDIGPDLVSLSLVVDPFSDVAPAYLESCFDLARPFKTHYVADLGHPLDSFVGKVHRKNTRRSLEMMDVEVCGQPARYLDDWVRLYGNLISRHHIRGIHAFSHQSFEVQLSVPGMDMLLGRREGKIIGATLILRSNNAAYTHLSAFAAEGYEISASYGLHWKKLEYCQEQGIRYVSLGGVAGIKEDPSDGLDVFKRGWSNDKRTVFFCGRIFDRQKYESICRQYKAGDADYFPAYRKGEFI